MALCNGHIAGRQRPLVVELKTTEHERGEFRLSRVKKLDGIGLCNGLLFYTIAHEIVSIKPTRSFAASPVRPLCRHHITGMPVAALRARFLAWLDQHEVRELADTEPSPV